MTRKYELLSIGNAIADVLGHVPEEFINDNGLEKGAMRLVDSEMSAQLLESLRSGPIMTTAGGSAANTAACVGLLGGRSAYIGKVGTDALGDLFRKSMETAGVDFHCASPHDIVPTATCVAAVTPDGERTMNTYLGACRELGPEDIPEDLVMDSELLLLEGYLLDSPTSAEALRHACRIARRAATPVAISLSDANCVRRHLKTLRELIDHCLVQIIVANEKEMAALFEVETAEEAFKLALRDLVQTCVVTMGSKGAVVFSGFGDGLGHDVGTHVRRIPAAAVETIVDLVGAGDSFAAGFLLGHVRWADDVRAASLGAACAAAVISAAGARPARPFPEYENVQQQIKPRPRDATARFCDEAVAALLAFDRAALAHLERFHEAGEHDPATWSEVIDRSDAMSSMGDDHLLAYMSSFRLLSHRLRDGLNINDGEYRTICINARRNAFKHHVEKSVLAPLPI